mgnify:CR=1 FL=1
MQQIKDKVAVITGAGSGIGRALAMALAKQGCKLALNDWNGDSLAETVQMLGDQTEVQSATFDVGDRESVYGFAQNVKDHFGRVDIVVNNAGFTLEQKRIEDIDIEDYERIMRVNMWGVIYGTKAFLPFLQEQPEASLVNISSIFGIVGQPLQGPYVASKFAVRGFTETLRNELRKSSVAITCVHPGGIRTNIIRNIETNQQARLQKFANAFDKMAGTSAEDAAAQILNAIQKKKVRLLIGRDAKMMDLAARLLPRTYDKLIYRNLDIERIRIK